MVQQTGMTNRYRIISKLCSGGMADIFLGIQLDQKVLDRLVVIKKVHDVADSDNDILGMFADEARIISTLSHPHVIQIFDFTQDRESFHLVMEYIDGENLGYILSELRKRKMSVPLPVVFRLMDQALEALHYIHNAKSRLGEPLNIVHRDLDPRNLMMDSNGYLKIIDFGVAKAVVQTELTAPGLFKGKLTHVAPEIFTTSDVDHRADIYSIGLVLFELVTGEKPYSFGKSPVLVDTINKIVDEPIPIPSHKNPNVPKELEAVILRACAKDRNNRYQSAEALHDALTGLAYRILGTGVASNAEVKQWFNMNFAERLTKRRKFENQTLQKAKRHLESLNPSRQSYPVTLTDEENAAVPTVTVEDTMQRCRISVIETDSGISFGGGTAENAANPSINDIYSSRHSDALTPMKIFNTGDTSDEFRAIPRRRFYKVLAVSTLLSLVVFATLFLLWPEELPSKNKTSAIDNSDKDAVQKIGSVSVTSLSGEEPPSNTPPESEQQESPPSSLLSQKETNDAEGADTASDGSQQEVAVLSVVHSRRSKKERKSSRRQHREKESAYPVPPTPSSNPTAEGVAPSYQSTDDDTSISNEANNIGSTQPSNTIPRKQEVKPTVSLLSMPDTRKSEPTFKTRPAPITQKKEQAVPKYLSKSGNWNGATVAKKGCGHCHSNLEAASKTASQWEYFFSHNRHKKHRDLKMIFSKGELRRVQSYLVSTSKKNNVKSSGIAGIR